MNPVSLNLELELSISLREPDQNASMNVDSGVTCTL